MRVELAVDEQHHERRVEHRQREDDRGSQLTNVIQTKSGRRRIVIPGARRVSTVAMRLIAAADRADAEHEQRERPVVGARASR